MASRVLSDIRLNADDTLGCAICYDAVVAQPVRLSHCCRRTVCAPCLEQMLELTSSCCCFCRARLRTWVRTAGGIASLVDPALARLASERLADLAVPLDIGDVEETAPNSSEKDAPDRAPPPGSAAEGELRAWFESESAKAAAEARREQAIKEADSLRGTIAAAMSSGAGAMFSPAELDALRSQLAALERDVADPLPTEELNNDGDGDLELLSASGGAGATAGMSSTASSGFAFTSALGGQKRRRLMQTKMHAFPSRPASETCWSEAGVSASKSLVPSGAGQMAAGTAKMDAQPPRPRKDVRATILAFMAPREPFANAQLQPSASSRVPSRRGSEIGDDWDREEVELVQDQSCSGEATAPSSSSPLGLPGARPVASSASGVIDLSSPLALGAFSSGAASARRLASSSSPSPRVRSTSSVDGSFATDALHASMIAAHQSPSLEAGSQRARSSMLGASDISTLSVMTSSNEGPTAADESLIVLGDGDECGDAYAHGNSPGVRSSQREAAAASGKKASAGWSCGVCTLRNASAASACAACGTSARKVAATAASHQRGIGASTKGGAVVSRTGSKAGKTTAGSASSLASGGAPKARFFAAGLAAASAGDKKQSSSQTSTAGVVR